MSVTIFAVHILRTSYRVDLLIFQIPVLKSHVSLRQFKLPKDGIEDNTNELQQWFKRKASVWPADITHLHNNEKVRAYLCNTTANVVHLFIFYFVIMTVRIRIRPIQKFVS